MECFANLHQLNASVFKFSFEVANFKSFLLKGRERCILCSGNSDACAKLLHGILRSFPCFRKWKCFIHHMAIRQNECEIAKIYMAKSPPWVKSCQMADLFPLYFLLFPLQGKYIKGHGPHLFSELHSFSPVVVQIIQGLIPFCMDEVHHHHLLSSLPFSDRTAIPGSNPPRGSTYIPFPNVLAETVLLLKAVGTYKIHQSNEKQLKCCCPDDIFAFVKSHSKIKRCKLTSFYLLHLQRNF